MKPKMNLYRLLALAWLAIPLVIAGESSARVDASERVALDVLYVPAEGWAEVDENGAMSGVTVEIMQAFSEWLSEDRSIKVDLRFEAEPDWTRFYARVREASGALFGLGNVTITDQRAEELAFSSPYMNNIAVLISPADAAGQVDPETLRRHFGQLRALGFAGTLHERRLQALAETYWPDMPLDTARSNEEIVEAVAAGTHFAFIDGYNYHRARDQGLAIKRHPAFDDGGETFGIIMPLDNPWQAALQEFFDEGGGLLQTRWYRELLSRHLGTEVAELLLSEVH